LLSRSGSTYTSKNTSGRTSTNVRWNCVTAPYQTGSSHAVSYLTKEKAIPPLSKDRGFLALNS
jgi:hypothetical protein